ncbi:MAG: uroporphyrinogen-III C-methyltransferase [Deltaproteobacteria bacterium]|nr:MAG: uroporphyrinogen-III C-methyltransferase [Deltaproteobacteria bacterium]
MSVATGRVSLVGAGPGDPGLLTLRGRECLARCDVVVYDNLSNPALLAHSRADAEIVFTGKHGSGVRLSQEEISRIVLARARAGKWVVRLKGGDPFIFGRGGEEALECVRAGIPFEVVPGVTSAIAAPAYAGIPLTHRDYASTVTFVTGHESDKPDLAPSLPWEALARQGGTLVLFMSVLQLGENLGRLVAGGLAVETPAAAIRWGTTGRQQVLLGSVATLPELARAQHLRPPAIVVVGDVVRLAPELRWFDRRPLFGRRIVVTRARAQAAAFATLLEQQGAEVVTLPTIATVPPEGWDAVDAALARLREYGWLVLTSENGVAAFFDRLRETGRDVRDLAGVAIAAIGPQTRAAIEARGLRVALTPPEYRAEAVADALVAAGVTGRRVLLARAAAARAILPQRLAAAGAVVDEVAVYRTVVPAEAAAAPALFAGDRPPHMVTFTSSSTVTNFARLFPSSELQRLLNSTAVGCIGPITAGTTRGLGLRVDVQPAEYTIPAFAAAIVEYFAR